MFLLRNPVMDKQQSKRYPNPSKKAIAQTMNRQIVNF